MIKVVDCLSKQVEDFMSHSHASERFSRYLSTLNNIQDAGKKEILADLNSNFHSNSQQCVGCIFSCEIRSEILDCFLLFTLTVTTYIELSFYTILTMSYEMESSDLSGIT
jgi:hypothetical protein